MRGHGMTGIERRGRSRKLLQDGNAVVAVAAAALVLGLLAVGHGSLPALGPALVPGHGVWASAAGAKLPADETLTLPGLSRPAQVTFTQQGVADVSASTDDDAFLALGYLHASFRLTQMDLERRLAEGTLAQLAGPKYVASDEFELRLGLLRTAQREWAAMPRSSQAAQALIAYSRGVNDYLAQLRASGQWPAVFSLAGVYPASWTPVDSLAVQGGLTQALDFSTTPLDYALLERSLGATDTMDWFPVLPPGQQDPYDPGPYRNLGLTPIGGSAQVTSAVRTDTPRSPHAQLSAAGTRAAAAILAQARALPAGQIYADPDSNAWAANGPKVVSTGSMLAGDPDIEQSLPSLWYEVALSAPGLQVTGVSVPGLPGVLIGQNAHIAWSVTNALNQSTLFYAEQTSSSRPGEYFWDGQWRRLRQLRYTIAVRGGSSQQLTVDIAAQGPILTRDGQTTAVDWMGALGSPDVTVMLAIDKASDYAQFSAALAQWRSPTLNFVYADDSDNIAAIAAGYFPVVRHGDPWLPLPGTGADDVAGVIPFRALPQVYDPPGHVVASANQRPVGDSYPYYIGTSSEYSFQPDYRASVEYAYLSRDSMTPANFAALQDNLTDALAAQIVPRLVRVLRAGQLTAAQKDAEEQLAGWDDQMTANSAAAAIWWTFWSDYLTAVFQPWWTAGSVPVSVDPAGLAVSPQQSSLDEVLADWTENDQGNPAFSPPGGPARAAPGVMRLAFDTAVAHLSATLGGTVAGWSWGQLHTREFPSDLQAAALGYGPVPAGGGPWTIDAAEGGLTSTVGPTWRMIASWSLPGQPAGEGIYPGGQSENPGSPWYENLVSDWASGKYLPMPWPATIASNPARAGGSAAGPVSWVLEP
jgi:penicillin G amidase